MSKYLTIRARALGVLIFALAISTLQVPYAAQASACSPTTFSYTDGGITYSVASFETVGNGCSWTAPSGVTTIDLLLIGGGGGGGGYAYAGGGGGGGFAEVMAYSVTPGSTYAVTVGDGGSGGLGTDVENTQGQDGGASSFETLTVTGGGGGGGWENNGISPRNYSPGRSGASGGGSSENGGAGGAVSQTLLSDGTTPVFGYDGGSNLGVNVYSGAGGGGAGGLGESVTQSDTPSAGGIGKASTIRTGSPITYSAGGTGGPGLYFSGYSWSNASSNTGNGGGGAKYIGYQLNSLGAKGGSGIVVVRYQLLAGITPTFDTPTATADGFYVTITNYDANYTWDVPTVTSGSVAITSTDGANRVLTVTGLSVGASATITQTTSRTGYASGSNTVAGTATTGAALTPTFDTPTATADGFYVTITNYDANYVWDTTTVTSGSVAITSTDGANRVLTVTGLSPGASATITQTTSRTGYASGSNTVAGTSTKGAALNPAFGSATRTADGFYVTITNYDANYIWVTPTVDRGSVAITSTSGSNRVLTVTGVTASQPATITQITSRTGYYNGLRTKTGIALGAALNPVFNFPARTEDGFIAIITNYSGSYTWDTPTVTAGSVAITSTIGANRTLTVTGLSPADSATITQTTSRTAYANGSRTVVGYALNAALNPTFDAPTATADGFSVTITNYDASYTWDSPIVTSGSVAITSTAGSNRVLTVTGLSAGDSATITQATRRSTYANGSRTVVGTASTRAALTPTFDTPTSTADGFSVTITNYDANYTWDTPTVTSGSVAAAAPVGSNRVLTVTGLSPSDSATITQATSRPGYSNGTNTVAGQALNAAWNPVFGEVTRTAGGFTVPITNYDSNYTWDTPTVTSGSVAVTSAGGWSTNSSVSGLSVIASSSDGTKLVAAQGLGSIYTSSDSGASWTIRVSDYWYGIASSSDGTKLAAAGLQGIWTSTDSGVTWRDPADSSPRGQNLAIASSSDGTKLAAVANDEYVYTSINSGDSWTVQTDAGLRRWSSIASSSDGTKLAAVVGVGAPGYIYTSSDSGATWTEQTVAGSRNWYSIASSSDGTKLAAVANNGFVYTSTDSGASWTARVSAGSRQWYSIVSSSDGTKLTAVVYNGYIYISTDSGATWTEQTSAGSRYWRSIATSSDGTKLAAAAGTISTFAPRVLTVTTLAAGDTATITQATSRTGYASGSNTVAGQALNSALTPTFGSSTRATGGFTLQISNYNASYNWSGTNSQSGSVSISDSGLITVTGLASDISSTVTITTTRSGYLSDSATSSSVISASTISTANIVIPVPVTGATPVTSLVSNGQYTTTITWSDSPARFAGITAYTATVTVTPNAGYTLTGVAANLFTVNGDTATIGNLVNAGSLTYLFTATGAKFAQSITFAQPADMSMTSDTQTLSATSSATGSYPVTFTSLTTGICTITNGAISVVAAGICSIRATQAGDGIYSAATGVIKSIAITSNLLTQSITFAQPAAMNTRSSSQALTATSSAGASYPVTLTSNTPLICTISSRAIVVVKSGTCSITASQAGNGSYQAATSVTRTVVISKVAQTITYSQPAAMTVTSNPRALSATTTADGRTVGFSSSSAACIVAEGVITVAAAGTCVITASQAGDDTYTAATSVTRSVVISKLTQTITFPQLDAMTITSSDQLLSATTNAIGSYSIGYASANTAICTIVASGPARSVHVVAPGTCSITATQLGDAIYTAAAIVNTFVIAKRTQTITFATPAVMTLSSDDQALSASSSAGGSYAVKFTSTTPSVCTIVNNNSVHVVSAGACSITASQAGNATYAPANNVMKSFIVASSKRR